MDNNNSDNFINQQDKPTTNPDQAESINNVEIQENGINSDLNYNAPNPVINPENTPKYPYNAPPQGYYNPYPPPNPYPYYPNAPQAYPYNPNVIGNQFPYNNNTVGVNVVPNPLASYRPNNCIKSMLLVMSILMFIFLISEILYFNSLGIYTENIFIIVDEIGILVVAILFLISFIFSYNNKDGINPIVRTAITVIVWFVGFAIRGMGNTMDHNFDYAYINFIFLRIRTFILFFSIPISTINGKLSRNN